SEAQTHRYFCCDTHGGKWAFVRGNANKIEQLIVLGKSIIGTAVLPVPHQVNLLQCSRRSGSSGHCTRPPKPRRPRRKTKRCPHTPWGRPPRCSGWYRRYTPTR